MPARFRIGFEVSDNSGWADVLVADGATELRMTISRVGDSELVGDLVNAAIGALRGRSESRFGWMDEPGEWTWLIRRRGDRVEVEVMFFEEWRETWHDERAGARVFHASVPVAAFARAALRAADRVRVDPGEDEYARRWRASFPAEALERLRSLFGEHRAALKRPSQALTQTSDP